MKARPEGEQCGQNLREQKQDVKAKSLWQSGVQGMTMVRHRKSKTKDAESSKDKRVRAGTSKIRLTVQESSHSVTVWGVSLSQPPQQPF